MGFEIVFITVFYSDAVEILCVSFILPSAECELKLTPEGKGILTAVIFIGMMFGGYLWGSIGDSIGRKYTLVTSLLFNSLGTFLMNSSALS